MCGRLAPVKDDDWMRPALASLIDDIDDATARRALREPAIFGEVRGLIEGAHAIAMPEADRGDNLLMALLALRVKFPPDEARAKLETNLAMRRPPPLADRNAS